MHLYVQLFYLRYILVNIVKINSKRVIIILLPTTNNIGNNENNYSIYKNHWNWRNSVINEVYDTIIYDNKVFYIHIILLLIFLYNRFKYYFILRKYSNNQQQQQQNTTYILVMYNIFLRLTPNCTYSLCMYSHYYLPILHKIPITLFHLHLNIKPNNRITNELSVAVRIIRY